MGSYQKSTMCQDTKALNALHTQPILFSQGSWEASVALILVDVHFEKSLTPNNRQTDQQKFKRQGSICMVTCFASLGVGSPELARNPARQSEKGSPSFCSALLSVPSSSSCSPCQGYGAACCPSRHYVQILGGREEKRQRVKFTAAQAVLLE